MRLTTTWGRLLRQSAPIAALALAFSFTAHAATINVDSGTDDGAGCTLREAVQSANTDSSVGGCTAGDDNGDTITFSVGTVTLTAGQIEITEELDVQGSVTINAAPGSRIFQINGAESVDFSDVTFEGGAGNGAAFMIMDGADVTVTGGAANNGLAPLFGGAFWVSDDGSLSVDGTTFTGNRARGAAADQGGGAIYTDGGDVTVDDATFTDNRAIGTSGSGGAILNPNGATLMVTNSTFTTNRSQRAGGAIETVGGTTTVTGTSFQMNNAGANPGNGGAIHGGGDATVNITGGTAGQNRAIEGGAFWISGSGTMTIDGTTMGGNFANGDDADQGGGGLYVDGGTATVSGAVFLDNRAAGSAGSGGAILVNGGSLTVNMMTDFTQNRSNRAGGAIEVTAPNSDDAVTVDIDGATFTFNQTGPSPGNGGAIHTTTGDITLSILGSSFDDNIAGAEGGGVWINTGTTMTATGASFSRNAGRGTGADNGGGGFFNNGGTATFNEGTFVDNVANQGSGSGGAVLAVAGTTTFNGTTFTGNFANRAGGAFEVTDGATLNVSDAVVDGNRTGASPGNGGGLHVTGGGIVTIDGSEFTDNMAENQGGGIWNFSVGTMEITRTTVSGNRAPVGGGIYQQGGPNTSGSLMISESLVANNVANQNGGGLALFEGATVTVENVTIYGNVSRFGGGVYSIGSDADFDSATIAENTARTSGGGLFNEDSNDRPVALRNTIVADNTAQNGTNLAGRYASEGWNLIGTTPAATTFPAMMSDQTGVDPMLGPLADNGGTTMTAALLAGSPAIDAGDTDLGFDQRGVTRTEPDDVGAFEFGDADGGEDDPAMALILTGVVDGPLSGGVPKAAEIYVTQDVDDLSLYAIGSANNGGGTDGAEFYLTGSASAGDFLYVASETDGFTSFFGFAPDFTSGALGINGDDAVELFYDDDGEVGGNGAVVIDTFGETDATPGPWDYQDGWAYRMDGTGPDGSTFVLDNWTFSGVDALDGETTNETAQTPFPIGTYSEDDDDDDMRMAAPAAAREAMTEPVTLSVAPNPLSGRARTTFAVREAQDVAVRVFDVTGRQVQALYAGPVEAETPVTVSVDGGALASGVYVVVVEGQTVRTTQTVTVVR